MKGALGMPRGFRSSATAVDILKCGQSAGLVCLVAGHLTADFLISNHDDVQKITILWLDSNHGGLRYKSHIKSHPQQHEISILYVYALRFHAISLTHF
jgi:hypothetical protein